MTKERAKFTRSENANFGRYLRTRTIVERVLGRKIGDEKSIDFKPDNRVVDTIDLELVRIRPSLFAMRIPERALKGIVGPNSDVAVVIGNKYVKIKFDSGNKTEVRDPVDISYELKDVKERYKGK